MLISLAFTSYVALHPLDAVTMKLPEPCLLKILPGIQQQSEHPTETRQRCRNVRANDTSEVEYAVVVDGVDLLPVLK
jgi:hypothetical protein